MRPSSDRDGECICDYNPETTDGPQEDCPFHGRPYTYWVERSDALGDRLRAVSTLLSDWESQNTHLGIERGNWGPSSAALHSALDGPSTSKDCDRGPCYLGAGHEGPCVPGGANDPRRDPFCHDCYWDDEGLCLTCYRKEET